MSPTAEESAFEKQLKKKAPDPATDASHSDEAK